MLNFLWMLANETPSTPLWEKIGYSTLLSIGFGALALFVRSEVTKSEKRITEYLQNTYTPKNLADEKDKNLTERIVKMETRVEAVSTRVHEAANNVVRLDERLKVFRELQAMLSSYSSRSDQSRPEDKDT